MNDTTSGRAAAATSLHDPRPVVLVACCDEKLPQAAPAADIYLSDLFRKARAWAERNGSRWFILSAKHGLLSPEEVIEPYDVSMVGRRRQERRAWDARVLAQLAEQGVSAGVVLAGKKYRGWMDGRPFTAPMEGMGIGDQKGWLKRQLAL
jgi:hypothetical protein